LDEFYLLAEQQDHEADDFLIDALFDRDAAVPLQTDSRDVLQGLDGGGIDEVEEADEVHSLLVSVQPEQDLDFIIRLRDAVLLQHLQDMPPGDQPLTSRDVVEERQWMEVGSGGDGLSVGLEDVLLLFQQCEVGADVVEDLALFQLGALGHALPVHNEYIIIL
jgi:hypothetical protein